MTTPPTDAKPGRGALLVAIPAASILLVALWTAFQLCAGWIHWHPPPIDVALVNPWVLLAALEHDGSELPVMFAAVSACLVLIVVLARRADRVPWPRSALLAGLCAVPALSIVAYTHSVSVQPPADWWGALVAAAVAAALAVVVVVVEDAVRSMRRTRFAVACAAWIAIGVLVVTSAPAPYAPDYGYFIAPALKLAGGASLGEFYMQYNHAGLLLFRAMMAFDLEAHEMQAVLGVVLVAALLLYHRIALALFEDRALAALFLLFLVVVRVLAVLGGPTFAPQVSAIRMDLWVVPVLTLVRFGWRSPVTASAFALVYAADNVFGFLCFALYGAAVVASFVADCVARRAPAPRIAAGVLVPLVAAITLQFAVYGSFSSPAAAVYREFHIGFLPIAVRSLFWCVAWMVFLASYLVASDPRPAQRRIGIFLIGVASMHLVYFYGRSHDNNLLNVAGGWAFVVFLGIDRLAACGLPRSAVRGIAGALVCVAGVSFAGPAERKLLRAEDRLLRGVLVEQSALDELLDSTPSFLTRYRGSGRKVMMVSCLDGYVNYRCGLPQVGPIVPFYANLLLDPTVALLIDLKEQGYDLVWLWNDSWDPDGLNSCRHLVESGRKFVVTSHPDGVPTLELVAR